MFSSVAFSFFVKKCLFLILRFYYYFAVTKVINDDDGKIKNIFKI